MDGKEKGSRGRVALPLLVALVMAWLMAVAGARGDGRATAAPDGWHTILPIYVDLGTAESEGGYYEFDPWRGVIYNSAIVDGVKVIRPIMPNGQAGTLLHLPEDLGKMTMADGGQYLYVATGFLDKIYKIDIDAWQIIDVWSLDANGTDYPYNIVQDLHQVTDDPNAVVVSHQGLESGAQYETAVYDASGMRPNTVTSMSPMLLTVGAPGIIYGQAGGKLHVMTVDADGITTLETHDDLLSGEIVYDDGYLFDRQGAVVSTEPYQLLGRFNSDGLVAPDVAAGKVYFLHSPTVFALPWLEVFDLATFRKVAAAALPMDPNIPWHPNFKTFFPAGDDLYAFSFNRGLHLLRFAILDHTAGMPVVANMFCADVVDDFSSPLYGWPAGDTPAARFGLTGSGQYAIKSRVTEPIMVESPFCRRRGFELSVEAQWVGQPGEYYGLRYLIHHPSLQPEGTAFLVSTTRRAWTYDIASDSPPDYERWAWTESDAIRPGNEVNQLRVVFDGHRILGYINGIEVYENHQLPSGGPPLTGVGLIMRPTYYNATAEAWFDNFTYREWKVIE